MAVRDQLKIEKLLRLVPNVDELDGFRELICRAGVRDPAKEWASSSAYTTVDKRIVSLEATEGALYEAEKALKEQVRVLFMEYRGILRSYWGDDHAGAAERFIRLGDAEAARGRFRRARLFFDSALDLTLPLGEKAPQILVLRRIARLLLGQGDLGEALQYYLRSEELARNVGDLRSRVIALTGSGNVLLYQGSWAKGEEQFRAALRLVDEWDDEGASLERAQLYNNLAMVLTRQDRLDEAEAWFDRALGLWSRIDSPADQAICYHNLGLLRQRQGRLMEACRMMRSALSLDIQSSLHAVIATDLALCHLSDGRQGEAERWGREAEEHAINSQAPYTLGHMYRGLGTLARERADEGGVTFYEKSLEIARSKGLPLLEGETLMEYAMLRGGMGQADEARAYLERAVEIFASQGADEELLRAEKAAAAIAPDHREAPTLTA